MPDQLTLPTCAICRAQPVAAWGDPCSGCITAFGSMLRRNPDGERLTQEQIEDSDRAVHRAYTSMRSPQ